MRKKRILRILTLGLVGLMLISALVGALIYLFS